MKTGINLLNPSLIRERELIKPMFILASSLIFLVSLTAYGVWVGQGTHELLIERNTLMAKVDGERRRIVEDGRNIVSPKPNSALIDKIALLEAELKARESTRQVVSDAGASSGFSGLLRAFSEAPSNGLWITGMHAGPAKNEFRISGGAVSAEKISDYIKILSTVDGVRGSSFTDVKISRGGPDPVSFTLSSVRAANK